MGKYFIKTNLSCEEKRNKPWFRIMTIADPPDYYLFNDRKAKDCILVFTLKPRSY